ncbi:MAG: TVP38/TMEM64 family protein [Desulfotalea sp.]
MNKPLVTLAIIITILAICILVEPIRTQIQQIFFLFGMYDVESIKGYILSFGMAAPLISFLLMIFQSIIAPLPAFLITFSNAALFGWVYGAILSWFSAMVGAALCFFIARSLGRKGTEKLVSKLALENIDVFFTKHGKYTILIARLLPFISFDVVSYAAGLTSMKFSTFLWATGLGQLPATIIYSYAGEMLTGETKTIVLGLLILFALSIFSILLKQIFTNKKTSQVVSV